VPSMHRSRVLCPLVLLVAAAVVVPLGGVRTASAADEGQAVVAPAPAAAAVPTNQVTVVMAVPRGGARDATTLATVVNAVDGPVAAFWSDQSLGSVRIGVGGQVDWPAQPYTSSCTNPTALLDEAQAKSGFAPGPGKHLLVYVPPTPGCADGFGEPGSGTGSGGRMYVSDVVPSLISHQFGHNFGLRDASALQCDRVVEAGTCRVVPRGDRYDVMGDPGQEMGSLSPMEAAALGFLDPSTYMTQTSAQGSAYQSLLPYGNRSFTGRTLRLLAPDGSAYWLEYRTPVGSDAWLGDTARNVEHLDSGVLIRRETRPGDPTYAEAGSLLLDATPSAPAAWDSDHQQGFSVGAPVRIAGGQYTISQLARPAGETNIGLQVAVVNTNGCIYANTPVPTSGVSLLTSGSASRAFVVGGDGALWSRLVTGSPAGWQSLGGGALYGPAAVSAGSTSYAFVVGRNGALFYRADAGDGWGPWTSLGGVLTATPAAASLGSGHLRVFGRGADGQLWSRELRNGSWSAWAGLGGNLTAPPSATADTLHDRVVVLVRGQDGYNWEQDLAAGSGPAPYQWVGIATCSSFAMDAVRAGSDPTRGAYLWGRTPVIYRGPWSTHIDGTFTSNPAVAFFSDGNALVAGRGLDGALWVFDTRTPGGPNLWDHTWQSLGGYLPG
jgi:hypothetical protein